MSFGLDDACMPLRTESVDGVLIGPSLDLWGVCVKQVTKEN